MINIRRKTFETNSSSTHSLVILNDVLYKEALKVASPEIFELFEEKFADDSKFTLEEVFESLKKIGATIDQENGILDLSNVPEDEFDFGYTTFKAYADPAHKLLLVLTIIDDEFIYYYDIDDYFTHRIKDLLYNTFKIKKGIKPKNGFTGIDHQSRDELIDSIRYDVENFILRKDYVLILSHD